MSQNNYILSFDIINHMIKTQPLVSVIISCFNLGEYIDEAVQSVLAQTYQNLEIIIINDGSTDQYTNELLALYYMPKTIIYQTSRHGVAAARNYGISKSHGEYICCLDADDKYEPNFFYKAIAIFEKDKDFKIGIVAPDFKRFGESDYIIRVPNYNKFLIANRNPLQSASMFRKRCWQETHGYNKDKKLSGYEDWDFWIKIISLGYKWKNIPQPLIYYRDRANSMIKKEIVNYQERFTAILNHNSAFFKENCIEILKASNQMHQEEKTKIIKNYEQMLQDIYLSKFFKVWRKYDYVLKRIKLR